METLEELQRKYAEIEKLTNKYGDELLLLARKISRLRKVEGMPTMTLKLAKEMLAEASFLEEWMGRDVARQNRELIAKAVTM